MAELKRKRGLISGHKIIGSVIFFNLSKITSTSKSNIILMFTRDLALPLKRTPNFQKIPRAYSFMYIYMSFIFIYTYL